MSAVAWPVRCSARFADTGGAQSRFAQTVRAFFPKSTALLGDATRPGFFNPRSVRVRVETVNCG